jgi:ABC-type multidrug transport system fused ATPase/permease subunit
MKKVFKLFFDLLSKKERKTLGYLLFVIIFSTLLESITIALLYPIINILQSSNNVTNLKYNYFFKILKGNFYFNFQLKLIMIFFVFIFLKSLVSYLVTKKQISFSTQLNQRISSALYKKYIHYPYYIYLESTSSKYIRNLTLEVSNFFNFILNPLLILFTEVILLFSILAILLFINFKIASFLVLFFLFLYFTYNKFSKKAILELGNQNQNNNNKLIKTIQESFSGIREIKLFKLENYFTIKVDKTLIELSIGIKNNLIYSTVPRIILDFLFYFIFICILLFGYYFSDINSLFPIIGAFAAAGLKILPGINKIVTSYSSINYGTASMIEIHDELNSNFSNLFENNSSKTYDIDLVNSLKFQDIDFSYNQSNKLILDNLNFEIKYNTFTAIIGESGSGKTTLMHIILGLLKQSKGKIYSNGKEIELNSEAWMNKIGYLPQSVFIADDTIKNNITLFQSDDNVDFELLNLSIKLARLDNLVQSLPQGYNYNVGERGSNISGGEIQRIGIARLIYNKKSVIIFDEPTSALDSKTEIEIIETIVSLKDTCTLIIVTHNKNLLKHVDFAYELKGKKILLVS